MSNGLSTHNVTIGRLLCIFGFTGAHRFYFGKRKSGLLMFLVALSCWLVFPLVILIPWWIVDFFLISGMDKAADQRYRSGPLNYSVAWLLMTFLGLFGAHRFYQGKVATGLLFALSGGLFGVGWLYDFWTLNQQISDSNASRMDK
jgi:TM2 domain-containing membrane protein YozV